MARKVGYAQDSPNPKQTLYENATTHTSTEIESIENSTKSEYVDDNLHDYWEFLFLSAFFRLPKSSDFGGSLGASHGPPSRPFQARFHTC